MSKRILAGRYAKRIALSATLLASLCPIWTISAQDSNLSIATTLATECVAPLVEAVDEFGYIFDTSMSTLEAGIVDRWMTAGKTATKLDEPPTDNKPAYIVFELQHLAVDYEALKKKKLQRNVAVRVSGLAFENNVATASVVNCPGTYTDVIERADVELIEDANIPQTAGVIPPRGFIRRFGQTIIVGAASAVTVYLLFNVRSDEAGS